MRRIAIIAVAVFVALAASVPVARAQGGTYTTIDYPGASATAVYGINTAGDMVGAFVGRAHSVHGFLLSRGVYTQLDVPPTTNTTVAYGINDVGQVVGGSIGSVFWVYDTQTQMYTVFPYPGPWVNTTATGITNAGVIVGYTQHFGNPTAHFIGLELNGTTFTIAKLPGADSTFLLGINNSGQVIGLSIDFQGVGTTYLMEKGKPHRQILVPGIPSALAAGINDGGAIVGSYSDAYHEAGFVWQQSGLERIRYPGKPFTFANGINNAGQVVGYYYGTNFQRTHGFLWTPPADPAKK